MAPTQQPWASKVILLTRGHSELAYTLARRMIKTLRPRAIVLLADAQPSHLLEVREELDQVAWLLDAEDDADEAHMTTNPSGTDPRGIGTHRSQPDTDAGPTLITTIAFEPDAQAFPQLLGAVKEAVALYGRLDLVLALPAEREAGQGGVQSPTLTTADLIPVLAQAPYFAEVPIRQAAKGSSSTLPRSSSALAADRRAAPPTTPDSNAPPWTTRFKAPRIRATPPAEEPWATHWTELVRGTVDLLHAAVPALACPPRVLLGGRATAARVREPVAGGADDWPAPTGFLVVTVRGNDEALHPAQAAALAATDALLQSYAAILPTPTAGPDLPHPPIPRVRLARLNVQITSTGSADVVAAVTADEICVFAQELVRESGPGASPAYLLKTKSLSASSKP